MFLLAQHTTDGIATVAAMIYHIRYNKNVKATVQLKVFTYMNYLDLYIGWMVQTDTLQNLQLFINLLMKLVLVKAMKTFLCCSCSSLTSSSTIVSFVTKMPKRKIKIQVTK